MFEISTENEKNPKEFTLENINFYKSRRLDEKRT